MLPPCIPHGVPRKQVISQPSGPSTPPRIPAQVLVDVDQWEKFAAVAGAQNRSRSAQVRELIRRDIEAHEQGQVAA